jgi:hypothetical protein
MKTKTIKAVLRKKFDQFTASIKDESVRKLVEKNTIITGGAIASMLLREPVNDFDLYFRDRATAEAVADYYVAEFAAAGHQLKVEVNPDTGRIRIVVPKGYRGATAGDHEEITDSGAIEDRYDEVEKQALETEDEAGKPQFRPVFMSTNAITLSQKIQLVLRFYGEPDVIHESYDFIHCTNFWTSWDNQLVLRQDALSSLLTKELRYVGSKYPVCSVIRLRKFIARQWTVNAGQILKMLMQINELDLTDPKVLEDQLTGVDSAFFLDVLDRLKDKDPETINAAYLCEIMDRIF